MVPPEDDPVVVRRRKSEKASDSDKSLKQPKSWKFKLVVGVLAVVFVGAAVVGGAALWGLWSVSRIDRVDVALSDVGTPEEPFNMLVVGSDSREKITKDDKSASGMLGREAPSGQRSDSLMVARVDLVNDRVDLLSIPRDLWVPIAGKGSSQRINTAYAKSAQTTIDTIEQNLGIPIHHFAEVDFTGFRSLIDALGGVPMYFKYPVKDLNSGLNITARGCSVLDGDMGLAFARARHLQWHNGERWVSDPSGDLGRMTRQQLLTRASLARARSLGLSDVTKLKGLVDAAVGSVRLDLKWGTGDLVGVGRRLAEMDPQRMQTHALPVRPHTTSGGASVVLLNEAEAAPVLEIFKGNAVTPPVTTTTMPPPSPGDVRVEVLNSSAAKGEGRRVSYVFEDAGFTVGSVGDGDSDLRRTEVRYAKGQKAFGVLVAGWINPAPRLREDKSQKVGTVVVDLGSDFAKIFEPEESPDTTDAKSSDATDATGSETGDTTDSETSNSTDSRSPSTTAVPSSSTTTTEPPGWTPGVAPEGTVCR